MHQGDLDKQKGGCHTNAVDEVEHHHDSKVTISLSIDRSEQLVSQVLAADTKAEITLHL